MIRRSRVRAAADQVPNAAGMSDRLNDRLAVWDRAGGWILGISVVALSGLLLAVVIRLYGGAL